MRKCFRKSGAKIWHFNDMSRFFTTNPQNKHVLFSLQIGMTFWMSYAKFSNNYRVNIIPHSIKKKWHWYKHENKDIHIRTLIELFGNK
jgi:hypothetical protein